MLCAWNPSDSEGWGRRIMFEANLDDFVRLCLKINIRTGFTPQYQSGRKRIKEEPDTVVHSYNPATREAEAEKSQVCGYHGKQWDSVSKIKRARDVDQW